MNEEIAVTGATGQIGRRIATRLVEAGAAPRLLVRGTSRTPSLSPPALPPEIGRGSSLPGAVPVSIGTGYADALAVRGALDGVGTLFLVSGRESADRVSEHRAVVDAAVAAGVRRIVYLSFLGAAPDCTFTFGRDHWHTEQHIRGTGLAFTFLRDSFYASMLPALVGADGALRGPGGDGRVSAVAPDDVADVAAAVLRDPADHDGQTYDVTGPAAITLQEAADELSRRVGRPIRYQPETLEEAYASRAVYGAPEFEVAGWVTSYQAIADGSLSAVSDTVSRVAGHPARSFAEYLDADPDSYSHLR
ncbi:NmrA family NAD(P)-binding protein [Cryptosporangium minutisporangium]|uniref:SDR family oxidoreductase n=1 Tax=Cryptosporangium minutisporangium TaxID=113569 RepID=A0ABP6T317_9ACTN